jgi:predicted permease
MPPTFRYFVGARTDAWIPVAVSDADRVVARLRPGLTVTQAQQQLNAALSSPSTTWKPLAVEIVPSDWMRAGGAYSLNGRSTRAMLYSLLGAVGLVLAIASANVANLLVSRTLTRQREIAVRGSLGATRGRLTRQFLTEGLVLTLLGGLAALALAWCGVNALPAIMPAEMVYSVFGAASADLDGRVLMFACLTAVITGTICGAAPALRASRPKTAARLLGAGQRVAGPSKTERRLRNAFQTLQVAISVILLSGAGLLITSFVRMVSVPPGFNSNNLSYATLTFPRSMRTSVTRRSFFDELIQRMRTIPGVTGVAVGPAPVAGYSGAKFLVDEATGLSPNGTVHLEHFHVRPDYFHVVGIPLIEGRFFSSEDQQGAMPVAIVSARAAERFWPGRSAIGQRFRRFEGEPPITIVGVVPAVRTIQLPQNGVEAYLPAAQAGEMTGIVFRSSGNPVPVIAAVRALVSTIAPGVVVSRIGMVDKLFEEFDPLGSTRFLAILLGLFAVFGLVTAAVGLYGVLSHSVSRRTHEIGVRLALGAGLGRVRWLVLSEVFSPVAVGIATGLLATFWLTRFVESQLFQVAPNDPWVLGAIVTVLVSVCGIAIFVPMRRAAHVEPAEALRVE